MIKKQPKTTKNDPLSMYRVKQSLKELVTSRKNSLTNTSKHGLIKVKPAIPETSTR